MSSEKDKKPTKKGGRREGSGRKYLWRDKRKNVRVTEEIHLYSKDHRGWLTDSLIKAFDELPKEIQEHYIRLTKKE